MLQVVQSEEEIYRCPDSQGWVRRMPQLATLLAASAPQLRSLEVYYPTNAIPDPASALPAAVGWLSQLTSLSLKVGLAPVTAAQVRRYEFLHNAVEIP